MRSFSSEDAYMAGYEAATRYLQGVNVGRKNTLRNAYDALQQLQVSAGNGNLQGEENQQIASGVLDLLENNQLIDEPGLDALVKSLRVVSDGAVSTLNPYAVGAEIATAIENYRKELQSAVS